MDNNQWNQGNQNNQWNQTGNQWEQNNPQWNQNNQQYNNQMNINNSQGYYASPQNGVYNNPVYGNVTPPKKKGPGCLIAVLVILAVLGLGIFGVVKLITGLFGGDVEYDDSIAFETIVEDEIESAEATEEVISTEATEEVQLDEKVQGNIPTPEELADVLKSLEFNPVNCSDDRVETSVLDIEYQVYDNRMSAEITYEALIDTFRDKVVAKHVDDVHYAYEILSETDRDGYKINYILGTCHDKECNIDLDRHYYSAYTVDVIILKGNTVLEYAYEMEADRVQESTVKTFEKALERIEYVTVDKLEFNDELVESTTEEVEENTTEIEEASTVADSIQDVADATAKINDAIDTINDTLNK